MTTNLSETGSEPKINPEEIYPYKLLFSPLQINGLQLNNRLVWAAPLESGQIQRVYRPSPAYTAFLRERAAAGLALVFGGSINNCSPGEITDVAEEWGVLAKELNQYGCRLAVGISPLPLNKGLSTRRLKRSLEQMTANAISLDAAGVDAIYLDASAGTFLSWILARQHESLSFYYKTGSIYLLQVVAAIRKSLPADLPLFLRASPIHLDAKLLRSMKKLGLSGVLLQRENSFQGSLPVAKELREALNDEDSNFAVLAEIGAAESDPDFCELALIENKADAVVLSRALLAEPSWPKLAYSGRSIMQRPCILCHDLCAPAFFPGGLPGCSVNPRCGKENSYPVELRPAYPGQRLAVIGSGPAGMQAALTAWERGYHVSLFDHQANPFEWALQNAIRPDDAADADVTESAVDSALTDVPADVPVSETEVTSSADADIIVEGVIKLQPYSQEDDEDEEDVAPETAIDFSELTVGEIKRAAEADTIDLSSALNPTEDGENSEPETAPSSSLTETAADTEPITTTAFAPDTDVQTEDHETLTVKQLAQMPPTICGQDHHAALNTGTLKGRAWQRYSYYLLERLYNAQSRGELETYFKTEVTLAMLSQNRFDAIIVASGSGSSGNNYDVFHLIQDSYVSPIVKVAGAAAGTKDIAAAVRSGYAVALNI
ncbi:MAG: hypothetical protein ACOYEL_02030 [Saccharofermentanales bacterium]|jgi:2,4-dienoyl-CoA reductase-like NADH-dependent reductase (Old Yellow Enzyme family)